MLRLIIITQCVNAITRALTRVSLVLHTASAHTHALNTHYIITLLLPMRRRVSLSLCIAFATAASQVGPAKSNPAPPFCYKTGIQNHMGTTVIHSPSV
jgi:hypothetical protein